MDQRHTSPLSDPAPAPRRQQVWSDRIKSHHTHLRQQFDALAYTPEHAPTPSPARTCDATQPNNEDNGCRRLHGLDERGSAPHTVAADELDRWQRALQLPGEAQHRREYAAAMHDLATQAWERPSTPPELPEERSTSCPDKHGGSSEHVKSRKRPRSDESEAAARRLNDRIVYCLDCLSSYFLGKLCDGEGSSYAESLPTIFSRAIKPMRQAFYRLHDRMANTEEIEEMIDKTSAASMHGCQAWARALTYRELCRSGARRGPSTPASVPPLRVLDVGSCYGPFSRRTAAHPCLGQVPLCVTALDLEPHDACAFQLNYVKAKEQAAVLSAPAVLKGDWLSIAFYDRDDRTAPEGSLWLDNDALRVRQTENSTYEVEGLRSAAYDAVFFCLLLSYLPSPRLRFRACLHAFLALEEGGLLVILSTRTQGSRRHPWVEEWIAALSTIGFERVHKSVRGKIVGLSFARRAAGRPAVVTLPTGSMADPTGHWASLTEQLACAEGRQAWMEAMLSTDAAQSGLTITADGANSL